MSGIDFVNDLNVRTLHDACEAIENAGECDRCPLRNCCLDVSSFMAVCEEVSAGMIDEFLGFSDDIENHYNAEDAVAYFADLKRKMDAEERDIDDRW